MTATTTTSIRRLVTLAAATAVGIVGFGAAPAAADAPTHGTVTNTFTATNPCTGDDHDITIAVEFSGHVGHGDRFVGQATRSGTTSDGYVMKNGRDAVQFNANVASGSLNDTWRRADGSMFKAQGHFVQKADGEIVVDTFRLRCITP